MPSSFFTGCYSSMTLPASCMWPPPCAPPSVCLFFLLFLLILLCLLFHVSPSPLLRSLSFSPSVPPLLLGAWVGVDGLHLYARQTSPMSGAHSRKNGVRFGRVPEGPRLCLVLRVQGVGWLPCTLLTFERERKASFRWPSLPFFGVLLLLFDAQPGRANPLAPRGGKSNLHSVIN